MSSLLLTVHIMVVFVGIVITTTAQQASGYYVVPSSSLSAEQNGFLESKIKQYLAAAGVSSVDGYYPMVTVCRYNEVDVMSYEGGMRNMYKLSADVSVSIEFEGASASLAATTISIEGTGYSKELARNNAIRSFKMPQDKVQELFATASKRAGSMVNAFAEKKMREVNTLLAKQECYDAADIISEIPAGSKHEAAILKLAQQASTCVDKQIQRENKQSDLAADRAFKMDSLEMTKEERIEKIRQGGMTQRTEINARSSARDRYILLFR
jgi:hypothetical protein